MSGTLTSKNFDRIWLEPREGADPYVGRQWCQDNQWGEAGVEYVRADLATAPADNVVGGDMTDEEIRQWIVACNHEPAKASLRHYLSLRATPAEEEQDRLRRMVERRDEFIIAKGLWDAFKEACRGED